MVGKERALEGGVEEGWGDKIDLCIDYILYRYIWYIISFLQRHTAAVCGIILLNKPTQVSNKVWG